MDYAHTDDALRNLTALAREFVQQAKQKGRVITVFGCGGDRDRAKRPLMGEAAGRGSDFVVLTSDNPRSEDPLAIINDAMVGLQRSGSKIQSGTGPENGNCSGHPRSPAGRYCSDRRQGSRERCRSLAKARTLSTTSKWPARSCASPDTAVKPRTLLPERTHEAAALTRCRVSFCRWRL